MQKLSAIYYPAEQRDSEALRVIIECRPSMCRGGVARAGWGWLGLAGAGWG